MTSKQEQESLAIVPQKGLKCLIILHYIAFRSNYNAIPLLPLHAMSTMTSGAHAFDQPFIQVVPFILLNLESHVFE